MRPAREAFWNASNAISVGRIGASPLLLLYPFFSGEAAAWTFGMGFLAVSLTDLLDGYLARRYGTVTRIGKLLDPLADKVLVMTALVLLVGVADRIPLWGIPLVVVILAREMAITGLRAMASAEGVVLAAAPLGKWKTGLQTAAITCLLVHHPFLILPTHEVGMALLVAATIVSTWSGYDYFAGYLRSRPS